MLLELPKHFAFTAPIHSKNIFAHFHTSPFTDLGLHWRSSLYFSAKNVYVSSCRLSGKLLFDKRQQKSAIRDLFAVNLSWICLICLSKTE